MNALGVADNENEKKKEEVCAHCVQAARAAEKLGAWETRWLVGQQSLSSRKIRKIDRDLLKKAAAYEPLLQFKAEKIETEPELEKICANRHQGLVNLWTQAKQLLLENKYDGIICYNSLYGLHRMFSLIAKRRGIPFLSLHHSHNAGIDDEFTLVRDDIFRFLRQLQKHFKKIRPDQRNLNHVNSMHDQAIFSSKKIWSYSSARENKPAFLPSQKYAKKVLVSLSSPDEVFAAQFINVVPESSRRHAFSNQIQWLRWVKLLAVRYPDVLFWIRPHPRLYPNKREKRISQLARLLEIERTTPAPENIFWPAPEEQGSVWHHLERTDILFNAWSTLADDFGKQGIPVITFFPDFSNSGRVVDYFSSSVEGYEKLFSRVIRNPSARSRKTLHQKWRFLFLKANTFSLSLKRSMLFRLISKVFPKKDKIIWNTRALFLKNSKTTVKNEKLNTLLLKLLSKKKGFSGKIRDTVVF